MVDPKSFVDNLKNLRLVTSVALGHMQANLTQFSKDASENQLRQSDRTINQIRTLSEQLDREFSTLQYLSDGYLHTQENHRPMRVYGDCPGFFRNSLVIGSVRQNDHRNSQHHPLTAAFDVFVVTLGGRNGPHVTKATTVIL